MDSQIPNPNKNDGGILHPLDAAAKGRTSAGTGFGGGLDFFDVGLGEPLEKFTSYDVPASPMLDLHEERAQNQSRLEKWGRGTAKMITTAGGAFVDGTAGIAAGIIQSVGQWDKSKFYDNVVGNSVDSMNEWMQENFPNYYTKEEQNAKGLAAMGYANFWADKTLNGVGYLAGMIASTAAGTGLLNIGGKALKASSLALKTHRVTRAAMLGEDAAAAMQGSARAAAALDASKTALLGFTSAFAEASVEARDLLRRKEAEFLEEAAKAQGIDVSNLSLQDREDAKEKAKGIANAAFALNSIVVGAGNVLVFGNLLRPKYLDARRGFGVNAIERNAKTKLWEDTLSKMSTRKRLLNQVAKPMGKGAVVEAFQEGTQYAIQEGGAEAVTTSNSVMEMVEAWGDAYSKTFSTKEGLDSTLVGAIVGILGGGAGSVRRHYTKRGKAAEKLRNEKRAQLIEFLNDPDMVNFTKRAAKTQESVDLGARMQKALEEGDHKTYRDIQTQLIAKEALQFADAGRLDLFYEKLDEALSMDDATFRENFGVPESMTELDKNKLINGIKRRTEEFIKLKNNFDARYQAPTRPGKNASKEEIAEWAAQTMEYDFLRNEVLGASFSIEDIDGRISKLVTEINELTEANLTEEEARLMDPEALNTKLLKALEDVAEKNPQKLDEAREKITDFARLAQDRAGAVRAINELQFDPEMRDAALARRKNRQDEAAKKQRSDAAVERANNATTEEELNAVLENEDEGGELTNEAKSKIGKKQAEVAKKARVIEASSLKKSVSQLEAEMEQTEDPIEKDILSKIITKRKAAGELDAIVVEPDVSKDDVEDSPIVTEADQTDGAPTVTEDDVNENPTPTKEEMEEEEGPEGETLFGEENAPSYNDDDAKGETDIVYKNNTYRVKYEGVGGENTITNIKTGKQIQTTSSVGRAVMNLWVEQQEQKDLSTKPTEASKERHQQNRTSKGGVQVQNGELTTTPNEQGRYQVELDENGEITEGFDKNQKSPDGTPLPINRQFVKETPQEDLIGMEIKFRVMDTQWSAENETDASNVPVGIYAQTANGEVLLGMLPADKTKVNPQRKQIGSGQITAGRISDIHAGNVITTVDETGEPVYFPLSEAIGEADVLIGTVRNDGTVRVSQQLDEADPNKAEQVEDMGAVGQNVSAGRIVLISPRPGVGLGVKMANTARLDNMAVQAVLNLLRENGENVAADVREIVGLGIDAAEDQEIYMQEEPMANVVIYFKHRSGETIQITGEQISKALKGEFFLFQVGSFQPVSETEVLESGEQVDNVVLDSFGKPRYRFQSESKQETEDMSEAEVKALKSERKARYEKLREEFIDSIEDKLRTKRRQVSIEDAYNNRPYTSKVTGNTYDSYIDYLSSPEELEEAQEDITSIVSVSGKSHNGSFYYDVQVKIDIFESDPEVSEKVATPQPTTQTKNRPKPAADFSSLRSETAKKKKRRRRPSTAEQKGEQTKKDCK